MQRTVSSSAHQVKSWSSLTSAWRKTPAQMLPQPMLHKPVDVLEVSTRESDRYLTSGKRVGELGSMPLFGRSVMDGSLILSFESSDRGIAESLHRKKIKKLLRSTDGAKLGLKNLSWRVNGVWHLQYWFNCLPVNHIHYAWNILILVTGVARKAPCPGSLTATFCSEVVKLVILLRTSVLFPILEIVSYSSISRWKRGRPLEFWSIHLWTMNISWACMLWAYDRQEYAFGVWGLHVGCKWICTGQTSSVFLLFLMGYKCSAWIPCRSQGA